MCIHLRNNNLRGIIVVFIDSGTAVRRVEVLLLLDVLCDALSFDVVSLDLSQLYRQSFV
jgi:hypothetical protein